MPLFWLFGTSVTGLRLTLTATFALFVLAAMYAFLGRRGLSPWQAALACAALAIDPSFSYAFRTQSYITLAPMAWLFLSLYSLARGGEEGARPVPWLVASGVLYGFAVVGDFIYAFFLPALLLAVRWSPRDAHGARVGRARRRRCARRLLLSPGIHVCHPAAGGLAAAWDYFQQTQRAINAFSDEAVSSRVWRTSATWSAPCSRTGFTIP